MADTAGQRATSPRHSQQDRVQRCINIKPIELDDASSANWRTTRHTPKHAAFYVLQTSALLTLLAALVLRTRRCSHRLWPPGCWPGTAVDCVRGEASGVTSGSRLIFLFVIIMAARIARSGPIRVAFGKTIAMLPAGDPSPCAPDRPLFCLRCDPRLRSQTGVALNLASRRPSSGEHGQWIMSPPS